MDKLLRLLRGQVSLQGSLELVIIPEDGEYSNSPSVYSGSPRRGREFEKGKR